MSITATRKVIPGIGAMSDAFKDGYEQASKDEYTGWNMQYAPNERTLVDFLLNFNGVLCSDLKAGRDCDYSVRWMAGLLAGYLRREA